MKLISVPAKFTFKLLAFFMATQIFFSCKKEIEAPQDSTNSAINTPKQNPNEFSRESTISAQDVRDWLETQGGDSAFHRQQEMVQDILESMQDGLMYTESIANTERNLIIVPVSNESISEHIVPNTPRLQYLLLIENEEGEIQSGDLVLFYPKDSEIETMPESMFSKFFDMQTLPLDGIFTLVNLNDVKQYTMQIDGGKPSKYELWTGRAPVEPPVGMELGQCIDWYLVTTIYWEDGEVEVFEEYLYTQCFGGSGGSGGGFGQNPLQGGVTVVNNPKLWMVAQIPNKYEIFIWYYFNGTLFTNNTALNRITNMTKSDLAHSVVGTAANPNNADLWRSTWAVTTNEATYTPQQGIGYVIGTITYVNQLNNPYYPNPYVAVSQTKYYPATVALN